ncbi:MAG TPA: tetratricopeptide repeat protein [Pyrinomonadaceae bacterium]|nr:tetratricopeptide repeat protein [Pyrinomonadaceae bacterium]
MKFLITVSLALVIALPGGWAQAEPRLSAGGMQARDTWRSVRTNNLFVIGNADPENLRQVALWLEFFHGAFGRLVSRRALDSSVPTTVIVFRDEVSFLPFKPLYQGRPANVSGFFQPGDDVNYIALSLNSGVRDPFATAFHEYVHLHLRESAPGIPLWLNEGLAEFYGSLQFSGGEALQGAPIAPYVRLLRNRELLPLTTLFSIDNNSPHYNEQDKSGIFYGQSWALVHYLMLGAGGPSENRQEQFRRFLQLVSRGDDADKALEKAFGMSLAVAETGLENYVQRGEFIAERVAIGDSVQASTSYAAMQRSSLSEGEANYYLGDLLLHIGRAQDAERYFKQAIALEPGFTPAYASLGQLSVQQQRYAEAKKYLQRATTSPQTYLIHYLYAYALSREGVNSTGQVGGYSRENVVVMRDQLLRSIKLAPDFAPALYLLALVDLVADEQLDEAEAMASKARQLAPSKSGYAILLAHVYVRRSNDEAARQLLERLTRDTDVAVRNEAQSLLDSLSQTGGSVRANGSRETVKLSNAITAEPAQPETSRVIGGALTGGALRDGQTIDNSGPMPTLDEVLARYMQASGGAAAINAVSSRVTKGTVDVVGVSRDVKFEIYSQAPNKTLMIMPALPLGPIKMGFNGRSGWAQTGSGIRAIKGVELAALQRDSDLYGPVTLRTNFAKISLLGKSNIGYREVYVLDLQPTLGAVERLYLDSGTYLPARVNTSRMVGRSEVPVEVYLDDWRAVDGIQLPFRISQSMPRLTLVFNVKEIQHNVALNAQMFDVPVKRTPRE